MVCFNCGVYVVCCGLGFGFCYSLCLGFVVVCTC